MNTKSILPIAKAPITTFLPYAAPLSILYNYKESYDWLFSHYIQIYAADKTGREPAESNPFTLCFYGDYDTRRLAWVLADFAVFRRELCPYLCTYEMPHELLKSSGETFTSYVKRNIDLSIYIYGHVNVGKIKVYGIDRNFHHHNQIRGLVRDNL